MMRGEDVAPGRRGLLENQLAFMASYGGLQLPNRPEP